MKSFFGNAIVKKTLSFILVLSVAAVAFATPLKPEGGFGDAKVYDSNYKAIQNPQEVSDNYVIRTFSSAVILNGGTIDAEVEANSLLQFISLGDEAVFYLLDGRAVFSSEAAFEVRTPVTVYKAQAGTSIYVITEETDETAFVDIGLAEARNLITGEVTTIGEGQYIDNSEKSFKPVSTTREEYWASEAPVSEQPAEKPVAEQPAPAAVAEEPAEKPVTEQPAATSATEHPAENQIEQQPVAEPVEVTRSEAAAQSVAHPGEAPTVSAQEPEKHAPETASVADKEETRGVEFGMTASLIWGRGEKGDSGFRDPQAFIDERAGMFVSNFYISVDPTISYKNFKFGLHIAFDIRSGKLVNYNFEDNHGITGAANSVARFISLFSFESNYDDGKFSIRADRTSELQFKSPIFSELGRAYDLEDKLLGTIDYSKGNFSFSAFVDDLQFTSKIKGRSQFLGLRLSYTLNTLEFGISYIADSRNGFSSLANYVSVDAGLTFSVKEINLALEGGAALQFRDSGNGAMVEMKLKKTSGWLTFGLGTAVTYQNYFNDIINNGPADVIRQFRHDDKIDAIDVSASIGISLKYFRFTANVSAPFALEGGSRLAYNTVLTRYGNTATVSVDTMNFQADVFLGKFTFTAGGVYNGFAGRLADFLKALKHNHGRFKALSALVDPEISSLYALASFNTDLWKGVLEIYIRADLMVARSKLAIPFSVGANYSF